MDMINSETLREVMLENRTEVMMHTVIPRNINLENFDRQVLVIGKNETRPLEFRSRATLFCFC